MVFKNIQRIKSELPEVIHIAMFYNNGIIFQTTFEQDINVPKLGENLSELLNHVIKVYEICNFKFEKYRKFIFETEDVSTIILKLGEDSNIALFFRKEEEKDLRLKAIRGYLDRIETLIDIDEIEILNSELSQKENDLKELKKKNEELSQKNKKLHNTLENPRIELSDSKKTEIGKDLKNIEDEQDIIYRDIEQKRKEIDNLKQTIEHKKKIV
jgi:uncharacterized protein YukE